MPIAPCKERHETEPLMVCPECDQWLGPRGKYSNIQFSIPHALTKANQGGYTQRELQKETFDYARENDIELSRY